MKNMQERKTTAESSGKNTQNGHNGTWVVCCSVDDDIFVAFHSVHKEYLKLFIVYYNKTHFWTIFVCGKFRGFFLIYFYV